MIFIALPSLSAFAHPHIWIDASITPRFGAGGLEGLHVHWIFDEENSELLVADADSNANGRVDPAEVFWIRDNMFLHLSAASYYLYVHDGTRFLPLGTPTGFTAGLDARGRLEYRFFVPLGATWAQVPRLRVTAFDPTLYIAYELVRPGASAASQAVAGRRVEIAVEDYGFTLPGLGYVDLPALVFKL